MNDPTDRIGLPVRAVVALVSFVGKETSIWTGFYPRSAYSLQQQDDASRRRQARRVDMFVLIWWILPFVFWFVTAKHFFPYWLQVSVLALLGLRIVNITFYNLRSALLEDPTPSGQYRSFKRSLALGLVNYAELILCFTAVYAWQPHMLIHHGAFSTDWFSPLYFSAITQLTIGYGDITPSGWVRPISCVQGICGLLLLVVTVGLMVSTLRPTQMGARNGNQPKNDLTK